GVCEVDACPTFVRDDCKRWDTEVAAAMPRVVLAAQDENGVVLDDVSVGVDGKAWLHRIDASPHALDPGTHVLRFTRRGEQAIERTVELREGGVKTVDVTFAALASGSTTSGDTTTRTSASAVP